MLDRLVVGAVPAKPHLVFRDTGGAQLYEECLTRQGFDGPFSLLYHRHRPHEMLPSEPALLLRAPEATPERGLLRRRYRCLELPELEGSAVESRVPLLFNEQLVIGFARPTRDDAAYFVNADADELYYVFGGSGLVRSVFGDLRFAAGDYVSIPKGTLHRFILEGGERHALLCLECRGGLSLPRHYRNAVGQLRMDAPYSHRDFRRPEFRGPLDEGLRELVVKRRDRAHGFRFRESPLDVVGWDGTVYPFAFPILAFQPRVGAVHLPPSVHATFEAAGALICSFVPRPLDFHADANPCPYPHSSVDIDEVLFYANSAFASHHGIDLGSLSHHPAGVAHGPHPGAYETLPSERRTEELAVMLDCSSPLHPTRDALAIEDLGYHATFVTAR